MTKEITAALCKFIQQVGTIEEKDNAQFGKFADLSTVLSTINPALAANGLAVIHTTKIYPLKIPKNIDIGVMINASEILSNHMSKKDFVNFSAGKNKSKISFIRFACHFNEVEKILPYINLLKRKLQKIKTRKPCKRFICY